MHNGDTSSDPISAGEEALYETVEVTPQNIKEVAAASGMSVEDLLKMGIVREMQGRALIIRYRIGGPAKEDA